MHDFSPRRQKNQPTRIFLANSFLGNISLDGSHRDTKYRALMQLYEKDAPADSETSSENVSTAQETSEAQSTVPSSSARQNAPVNAVKSSKTDRPRALGRSNSMRSKPSRRGSVTSSSSQSSIQTESPRSSDDEARDQEFPMREFKPRKILEKTGKKHLNDEAGDETVLMLAKVKTSRRTRRSSSGSYSKHVRIDPILTRRERATRTISASSGESSKPRHAFQRSGSVSPGHSESIAFITSSSSPIFESKDHLHDNEEDGFGQMSLDEALSHPGEILDTHRGIITEKREFVYTTSPTSQWPIAQFSCIAKYKPESIEEETRIVEKHDTEGRAVSFPNQSFIQRLAAQFTRNNSVNSVGSSRTSPTANPIQTATARIATARTTTARTATVRRPWVWPLKNRLTQQASHTHAPPIRPRRLSAASSIHIETETGALENLLGIKLSADAEDDLSYENLLIPLLWNIDWIGDLTPEEARNLLNTGEISVMSKLIGPNHSNTFDENLSRLLRRELSEYKPKYNNLSSQESTKASHDSVREDQPFAVDAYRPGILDDPEWEIAVRRQNIYLESYFSSIISNDLDPDKKKAALNELFRTKFPNIQLTFSKFKSIKRDMQKASTDNHVRLDLATVALSYVYFEKLVLKGFINKPNRKILASVCVMLAAKMNDLSKEEHKDLMHSIQNQMRVERGELNAFEFAVMVALGFDLHVPTRYVRFHYDRLSAKNEILPSIYTIPLPEPCPREKQRFSISVRPIHQINLPGFSNLGTQRVGRRTVNRKK